MMTQTVRTRLYSPTCCKKGWSPSSLPAKSSGRGGYTTKRKGVLVVAVVVQLLSCVQLFATLWTAACQASLSFTSSWSLLKLMSIELVMPSNHLILCHSSASLPALYLSQHQGLFQWVGSSHQVAKILELQLQHQSFWWIFRVDFL